MRTENRAMAVSDKLSEKWLERTAGPLKAAPPGPSPRERASRPQHAGGSFRSRGIFQTGSGKVMDLLRCPKCKGRLFLRTDFLGCANESCGMRFPLVDGVPVLINDENSVF